LKEEIKKAAGAWSAAKTRYGKKEEKDLYKGILLQARRICSVQRGNQLAKDIVAQLDDQRNVGRSTQR